MEHRLRFVLHFLYLLLSLVDHIEARQHHPPPKQIPNLAHEDISIPSCPMQGTEITTPSASSSKAKRQYGNTDYGYVTGPNSHCGFIEQNLHWPLYCPEKFYCATSAQYMPCCQNTYTGHVYLTWSATSTTTLRNTATITTTVTVTGTLDVPQYANCTSYGPCYDSTAAGNCTGSCTSTAVVCTDPYFPYCASIVPEYATEVSSFFCDTSACELTLNDRGYWPMTIATSSSGYMNLTRVYTDTSSSSSSFSTSTSSIFAPTPVPYTQHQPSRPQSVMQGAEGGGALRTASSATATSGADKASLRYYPTRLLGILPLMVATWMSCFL